MMSEFREVRYEPDDRVPWPLALGLGLQLVSLCINGVVLLPAVVFRAAGAEEHLLWAVFASVIACGFSAILQAARIGRIGAGYVLAHGSSVLFIAVCVTALDQGGPALLATLVVLSAVFQVGLSGRLSLLHRILTPVVMGTVIMLLPVTVVPILLDMMSQSPPDAPPVAGPLSAGVTVSVIVGIALTGTATLRLWAPVIGIVAGALVGATFGIYDVGLVADAAWVGIPSGRLPGFDLDFGPAFWGLLPAFLFAALIGLTQSVAMAIAGQRLAWRRPRAVDYRAVQRTVAAEGVGNVLAGIAGTIPSTPSAPSVAASEVTGVAARGVGIAAGITFLALALLPKALAVILAIPVGVVAGAILVILVMFFMVGMRESGAQRAERAHRTDLGHRLLDRHRVRVRHGLSRVLRELRRWPAEQRNDHRGSGRASADGGDDAARQPIPVQSRRDRAARGSANSFGPSPPAADWRRRGPGWRPPPRRRCSRFWSRDRRARTGTWAGRRPTPDRSSWS